MSAFFLGDTVGSGIDSIERTISSWLTGNLFPGPKQSPINFVTPPTPGVPTTALVYPYQPTQADIIDGVRQSYDVWRTEMVGANPPETSSLLGGGSGSTNWLIYGALAIGGIILLSNLSGRGR